MKSAHETHTRKGTEIVQYYITLKPIVIRLKSIPVVTSRGPVHGVTPSWLAMLKTNNIIALPTGTHSISLEVGGHNLRARVKGGVTSGCGAVGNGGDRLVGAGANPVAGLDLFLDVLQIVTGGVVDLIHNEDQHGDSIYIIRGLFSPFGMRNLVDRRQSW